MRISFVADYRSPIARQWIDGISSMGHDVQVISSRAVPAARDAPYLVETELLGGVAVAQHVVTSGTPGQRRSSWLTTARARVAPMARRVLDPLGPLEVRLHRRALHAKLNRFAPDIVHAMRLPYEGIATAGAWSRTPVIASIWGNDLTLYAERYRTVARATRATLRAVSALHTDCERDQDLARRWGYDDRRPSMVLPGAGGVRTDLFSPGPSPLRATLGIPADAPVVLNPRGVRGYVHIPEFLRAVALVLAERADVHIVCTGMSGVTAIEREIRRIPGNDRVHLLPVMSYPQMPDVYRLADITLSLTSHDGTPNSLLEALATGCFPIVGPVASVLEWIRDGENGRVVSVTDAEAIARTVLEAVDAPQLRERARSLNRSLVLARADFDRCMIVAERFYESVLGTAKGVTRR
jgi:glycosyltransferase involved in cell wall biosynthesis